MDFKNYDTGYSFPNLSLISKGYVDTNLGSLDSKLTTKLNQLEQNVDTIYVPPGFMTWWPTTNPPSGWLVRNGQAISRTTYARLFNVIGTRYGAGNGISTFNLPDDTFTTYEREAKSTQMHSDFPDFDRGYGVGSPFVAPSNGWLLVFGLQDSYDMGDSNRFWVNGSSGFPYHGDDGKGWSKGCVMFPVMQGDVIRDYRHGESFFFPMRGSNSSSTIAIDHESHNGMYLPIIKF